jgi:uncharacterized protein YuzE
MAVAEQIQEFLSLIPAMKKAPDHAVWLSYDAEADVLYVNFKKPGYANDSELTEDDVIVRYQDDAVVGFTVLHASKRRAKQRKPEKRPVKE